MAAVEKVTEEESCEEETKLLATVLLFDFTVEIETFPTE